VTVVVFHQRDKADSERLGALLRRSSDGPAEYQRSEADGWHAATVARLKSCFGRGLLILPSGSAQLVPGATVLVRFPAGGTQPAVSPASSPRGR
jgi:hypothetical protein